MHLKLLIILCHALDFALCRRLVVEFETTSDFSTHGIQIQLSDLEILVVQLLDLYLFILFI